MRIQVTGIGYVGSQLVDLCLQKGMQVNVVDKNQGKIDALRAKLPPSQSPLLRENPNSSVGFDISVICVPTPLGVNGQPDHSFVEEAALQALTTSSPNSLIILESTVSVGFTRRLQDVLDSHDTLGKRVRLAFSPERIDPGSKSFNISNTPKVVGAIDAGAQTRAENFYRSLDIQVVPVSSLEVAELSKLLENTYRLVNISFVNELASLSRELDVDVHEAISAASTKPFGFQAFYPGPGAGGHCIPVDPVFLAEALADKGLTSRTINLALEINKDMILKSADLTFKELKLSKNRNKFPVFIGLGYKSNSLDTRESPTVKIMENLQAAGQNPFFLRKCAPPNFSRFQGLEIHLLDSKKHILIGRKLDLETTAVPNLHDFEVIILDSKIEGFGKNLFDLG